MAGVAISVALDTAEADRALSGLIAAGDDPAPLLWQIGAALETSARGRITETNIGPDGVAWPPSERATREGNQTLEETGRLRDSIEAQVSGDELVVGSNVTYARIHQLGGERKVAARRQDLFFSFDFGADQFRPGFRSKGRSNFARTVDIGAHTVTMPARPYLGISAEDADEIEAISIDWLEEAAR